MLQLIRSHDIETCSAGEAAQSVGQYDPRHVDHLPKVLSDAEAERHRGVERATADRTHGHRSSHDDEADRG